MADGTRFLSSFSFDSNRPLSVYTWSSWPLDTASDHGSVVLPMLWGGSSDKISDFNTNMPKYTSPTVILGFNEYVVPLCPQSPWFLTLSLIESPRPNEGSQSNMSPSDAVKLWWAHMEPQTANGHRLCSPAVSSADNGFTWMQEFMSSCSGCSVSFVEYLTLRPVLMNLRSHVSLLTGTALTQKLSSRTKRSSSPNSAFPFSPLNSLPMYVLL